MVFRNARIVAFGSTRHAKNKVDKDPNIRALLEAETPAVSLFGKSWILHVRNALKVDFWDVDKMASQIVAILELPELRRTIIERAREEIRHIHWDAAAEKLVPVYESVLRG